MSTRLAAFQIIACLAAANTVAADRLWTYRAPSLIETYRQCPLGNLIITTPSSVIALDSETGTVQWQRDDLRPGHVGLAMFHLTPFGIVQANSDLSAIDLESGKTLWDMSVLPLEKVLGYLPVPEIGALLVFGKGDDSDKSVVLVDVATGEVKWQHSSLLDKKPDIECYSQSQIDGGFGKCGMFGAQGQTMMRHQSAIVHDGGIVFYVSKDGLVKVNAETGQLQWKAKKFKGKSAPVRGKGYAPFVVADDVIYVPYDRKLIAVNLTNGSVAWHHDKKFKSHVRQMEMSIEGLVVSGYKDAEAYTDIQKDGSKEEKVDPPSNFFMEVLVPETGVSSWEKPLTDLDAALPFFVDEDYAFVPRSGDIILVDLQQGHYNQFAKLRLKGNEVPTHVERVGKNFLVASPQNMVLFKSRGGMRYHVYYESPGATFWQKALMVTGGFVLDEIFDTQLEEPRYTTWGPAEVSTANRAFMQASLDAVRERFSMTTEGKKCRYIYTKQPLGGRKGYSLVKVDKSTGKEVGRIWIDEQFPDYKIDFATETVFAKESMNTIFAVR